MGAWTDVTALHNPATGTSPPASWGDGINNDLDLLRGAKAARVDTTQATTSTSYADLGTVGPSVTVDTGTSVIVWLSAQYSNTGDNYGMLSVAVSGATTVAAADANNAQMAGGNDDPFTTVSGTILLTGLTPGLNTFTMKYKTTAGTATFLFRTLAVIPLF